MNPVTQAFIDKIRENPRAFSQTTLGKTITKLYSLVPSSYDV